MADSIPRSYLKEITDSLAAEPLYVAFFKSDMSGYIETAASSLYSALSNEVSASGTGYTTGGYPLSALTSATIGTTNAVKMTASATTVTHARFTARYAVIYNHTSGKIRAIKDLKEDKIINNGTLTITWSSDNGVVKISFAA